MSTHLDDSCFALRILILCFLMKAAWSISRNIELTYYCTCADLEFTHKLFRYECLPTAKVTLDTEYCNGSPLLMAMLTVDEETLAIEYIFNITNSCESLPCNE